MLEKTFHRTVKLDRHDVLWVIIPCRNEEKYLEGCLDSFLGQTDQAFALVVVDNGSLDGTTHVARAWKEKHPEIRLEILQEEIPGTGRACHLACEHALSQGATMLARTDADSLADPNWVKQARRTLLHGYDFVGGKLKARPDEGSLRVLLKSMLLMMLIRILILMERIHNKTPISFVLMAGGNLALTAELYQFVGGFTTRDCNEDVDLTNRVLQATDNGGENKHMVIYTSLRRIDEYGVWKTLAWYVQKAKECS